MEKAIKKAKEARATKNKLMLNPSKSPINSKQLLYILQKTPKKHIYNRKGKGGKTFDYVTGVYIKKVLNYVFGWMWSFEVMEHGKEENQIWVLGRLTINTNKGSIIKTQFGRADIKYYKDKTKGMLDFGNDLKAATTDALKKCASELGIASDVYGSNEFKEIRKIDKGFAVPTEKIVKGGKKVEELKSMLKGETEKEKVADLKKRIGVKLTNFKGLKSDYISNLIATLLNKEVK